jgi:hypothetical protein
MQGGLDRGGREGERRSDSRTCFRKRSDPRRINYEFPRHEHTNPPFIYDPGNARLLCNSHSSPPPHQQILSGRGVNSILYYERGRS